MGIKSFVLVIYLIGTASAQLYNVCVSQSTSTSTCQSMSRDDSQVQCLRVESNVDCALKMSRQEADIGYFTEEETILLGQLPSNQYSVIATVRDADKLDPYAFEAVAIIPANHTTGLEGLRGSAYCHPGFNQEMKWSPRVLKTLEELAARTDRCPNAEFAGKTAEEIEVDTLNQFFSAACRPGTWSENATVDADLKSRYPNLCSLCGQSSDCSKYTIDMGVNIAGVRNENPHIQALECLKTNVNATQAAVAYVAWQHVQEYFNIRSSDIAGSFAVLCSDNTMVPLTPVVLANTTSPCALVRQPWGTIVAHPAKATTILNNLKSWWPDGTQPSANSWQSTMYGAVVRGSNTRVVFESAPLAPINYTQPIRDIMSEDAVSTCFPTRRWCVLSDKELNKCNWIKNSAYILGLQPSLSCQIRTTVFECLSDIKDDKVDFISTGSNYGYIARQHYRLSPVKLVQNNPTDAFRVAAFIKNSNTEITRFENLKGKNACFPEFGGLAYMAFVRAGQQRGVLPEQECDYARSVGEFFGGACAPGAVDATHALSDSSTFDSSVLCSTCKSTLTVVNGTTEPVCTWDSATNQYFGNRGSLNCLNDTRSDVAFLNLRNISSYLRDLGSDGTEYRALCYNNSLSLVSGVNIPDDCLLANVVDAEVLTRRNDPLYNSLNVLFDTLDKYFGYNAPNGNQLINLELFSPFDGDSNLLFKDSTIGLTEPSIYSSHGPAKRYIELFSHLQSCTGSANAVGVATRSVSSVVAMVIMAFMSRFVFA